MKVNCAAPARACVRSANCCKTIAKFLNALGFAVALAVTWAASLAALANDVSVTVMDSGFTQREGADVTIKDSTGKEVASGTTAREGGTGRPKFKTDLPPGTYTIEASWREGGKHETGTMTYTVTDAKNEPNVQTSPAGSGTGGAAGGVTVTGGDDRVRYDTPRLGGLRIRGQYNAGANFNDSNGIMAFPIYNGGFTGQHALNEDADFVGFSQQLKIGVGTSDLPDTGPGADRGFAYGRVRHSRGESGFSADQIAAPMGFNIELPGIGALNNLLRAQVDDVVAESEIEEWEFGVGMGLIFTLGPIANYTIGNIGNIGNIGPADRERNNNIRLLTGVDIFGKRRTQDDMLSFSDAGTPNRIDSELDTTQVGVLLKTKLSVPVAPGIKIGAGPVLGISRSSTDLSATLDRGGAMGSANDSDNSWSVAAGFQSSLSAKVGPGRLSFYGNYMHESKSPYLHLRDSNTDMTRIAYDSADSFEAGARYSMMFSSDIRLKTDIVRMGALPSGLPLYSFRYAGARERHVGVMAQEAMQLFPDAVREINGFLAVDYSRIR